MEIDNKPPINIIVAVDRFGGFGKAGKIPWHFPADLKRFKTLTGGAACIMGRNTYIDMLEMVKSRKKDDEKIEELLSGRQCIVVTSQANLITEGAMTASSLSDALLKAEKGRPIFVVGGEKMYVEALGSAMTVHMSVVKDEETMFECDRFFPVEFLHDKFTITEGGEDDDLYYVKYMRKNLNFK